MAFADRVVQYPGRITLKNVADPNDVKTYDVARAEGEETNPGTPLNAENLNAEIADAVDAAMQEFDIDANGNVKVRNIQCGKATVTVKAANTTYKKSVLFPQAFTSVPIVSATPVTGSPDKVSFGVTSISTTGFSITLNRTNVVNTIVNWIAMI